MLTKDGKMWLGMCTISLAAGNKAGNVIMKKPGADNICRSVDTVKACKRSIFQKMDVKNIAEAVTYAQNHQLI